MNHEQIALNSLLSKDAILRHKEAGNIIIDPFNLENLGTASYDVTLGQHFFREQNLGPLRNVYSPYSYHDVHDVWGRPQQAISARNLFPPQGLPIPEGISEDDKVILIGPGETILGHTQEFIGGRVCVTTTMHARSTAGRNFLEVCKCAGFGDVGYINRWTMEITNNSRHFAIPLVVGRRLAQIAFHQVDLFSGKDYSQSGKYQDGFDLDDLKRKWLPYMMLPQMWNDREVLK